MPESANQNADDSSQHPLMLLVDGHNMIFRSFSSVPRSIVDPEGNPVNGVYGLLGTLLRLIRDRQPAYAAVAFDVPEVPTFRHKLFPAYQGQRGPLGGDAAENFAWQVEQAKRVLEHVGIVPLTAPGFEADDIVGTLAEQAVQAHVNALIVSTDRDLQQLVQAGVRVLIPGKKPLEIGPEEVQERLGISPDRVVEWKVLAGDSSDNIPGVGGIGDKTAISLLEQFGGVTAIYRNLDRVPTRWRAALKAGRERANLFSQVVPVKTDLPLRVGIEDLRIDYERLPQSAGAGLRRLGLRPPE